MAIGPNDLKQFVLPTGVDASELSKYTLADGTSYEDVLADIADGIMLKWEMIQNDPRYGGMFSMTEELFAEYRSGGTSGMRERTEYGRGDAQRAETIGHMLPLKSYDRDLQWTWDFLRKARMMQISADVGAALDDVGHNMEIRLLTRFFTTTENSVGNTGYDVPFVNSTGGNVDFTPPPYDGQTFAATHTHFDRKTDDSTGRAAALAAGAAHLKEHGIMGPYDGIVPFADKSAFSALDNFVKPDRGIEYIATDSGQPYGQFSVPEEYFIGLYETDDGIVRLWATAHLPTDYLGVYKPYGFNDPRNPLMMRYAPDLGPAPFLKGGKGFEEFPLEGAVILHELGVGVSNRLNGYACRFDSSGAYSDSEPTIS